MRRVFLDARRLVRQRGALAPLRVQRRKQRLETRLFSWARGPITTRPCNDPPGRVLKHHHQLLTCLKVPGVPMDNSPAERAIRPHVIIRHRSYQSRSPTVAATHADIMSLLQTLTLQGRAIGEMLRTTYLRHRHGDLTPVVVSQS